MTKVNFNLTFDELYDSVKKYINEEDKLSLITRAYRFAYEKHFGVLRKSGESYIIHPLNVAYILTEIYADYETICAALLHDVVEDCSVSLNEINEKFGDSITILVNGVTKINKLNFGGDKEAILANQRKILVGLSDDVRVIIIKLADRLHNMRTLWALDDNKQKLKAKETLDILVPIAHRLGMYKIKSELEDLSLRYYRPEVYFQIVERLNKSKKERDNIIADMINSVSELLNGNNIKHEIKGRAKSIYSIYKKLDKGRSFNDIYDLNALRVFVDSESMCYQALGVVHSKYKPMPKRFKDYIARPKNNMYQSLHTTVFGNNGYLFEIQFRTYEMDQVAENGIASHWAYKEGKGGQDMQNEMENKLLFFKSIMELKDENDENFVNAVKNDVFENMIYVFTPNGDGIELPLHSTPIDFAYKVHTDVGNKMVGAIVNDAIVPLDYELKSNDVIKINTNKSSVPSREWINIARTSQAKNKIKAYFNKLEKNEYLKKGEELLKNEVKKRKIPLNDFFNNDNLNKIISELKCNDVNDLYINIGNGKFTINSVMEVINDSDVSHEEFLLNKINNKNVSSNSNVNDIIVDSTMNVKTCIASCCNPVMGDDILGYVTRGNGISVHRSICPNINSTDNRIVSLEWNLEVAKKYASTLLITTSDDKNILVDIVSKTTNSNIIIKSITNYSYKNGFKYRLIVMVNDVNKLNKFISDIRDIPNILEVIRFIDN